MVGVAQLVERWIVIPVVVGSIPIVHPIFLKGALIGRSGAFLFWGCGVHAFSVLVSLFEVERRPRGSWCSSSISCRANKVVASRALKMSW